MRRFRLLASYWLIGVLACSCSCSPDSANNSTPDTNKLKQYENAARMPKKQPAENEPWRGQFDVALNGRQSALLEQHLSDLRNYLEQAASGDDDLEITHKALKTGAPDNILLANIWFSGQLAGDDGPWQYELTLIWKDNSWQPFGGMAERRVDAERQPINPPEGRELDESLVARLLAGQ